jgi:hypothetical protein
MVASVDEVPYHDELVIRNVSSFFKQIFNVVELSVNISSKIARRVDTDNVALFCQYGLDLIAERPYS